MNILKGYRPITFNELRKMTQSELDNLLSVCWHDGKLRCHCVGINHVTFTDNKVTFSDSDGDPSIRFRDENNLIDNIGDGEWNYGLYKKL